MKNRLLAVLCLTGLAGALVRAEPGDFPAMEALERFKALEGRWQGKSPKGTDVQVSFELVAGGSAVLERYDDAGLGSPMITLYHLDGDELLLTHYCVAGNQPRMAAKSMTRDEIRFELVDVTNLASPSDGHMHRAWYRFEGRDRLETGWTYRESGRDSFTEVVTLDRVTGTE